MKHYVELGVYALANAGRLDGGNWFVGHFGAEVLSLSYLLLDKGVSEELEPLVMQHIEECINTHSRFFNDVPKLDDGEAECSLDDYVCEVESHIAELCVDGHHTIYSALALRALNLYPELARPEVIDGLITLLDACKKGGFDRYYGLDHTVFSNPEILAEFSFDSAIEAAKASLNQHSEVITDQEADGQYYFFSGSRLHLVTHAQALLELELLGYRNLVNAGLRSLQKHCICVDQMKKPEGAQAYQVQQVSDPRLASFWQRAKSNEHHGKLAYAVLSIFEYAPEVNQERVLEDLSVYWEFYS